jgi:hypothetical protein
VRIARQLVFGAALVGAALVSLTLAQEMSDEAALADELERAKSLFIHGSFPQAAAALGAIVAKLERQGRGSKARAMLIDAHFHLGLTYFALNASDSAIQSFKEVVRLDPRFRVDPARYAPRIVELFEQARAESERDSGELADSGEAPQAEDSSVEERSSRKERILVGAAGAAVGVTVGALTAGGSEAAPNASTLRDDDGDGFAAGDGDCNDQDPRIHPEGEVALRMTFAFTGTVACRTANPRQQTYEIVNNSCRPFSFLGLERNVTTLDTVGRTTASLRTSLPVDINFVAPATTAVIRMGASAGTTEALCRDLRLSNPFSRPKGDLRVNETYVVQTAGASEVSTSNSFLVLSTQECSFCSLDSIFGPYAVRSPVFRWQSELNVRGGSGQLLLNREQTLAVGPGAATLSAELTPGEILIEAQLLSADGHPGTWHFEFEQSDGFQRGSLTVRDGEVAVLVETAVRFRLRGEPGERVSFTFRILP